MIKDYLHSFKKGKVAHIAEIVDVFPCGSAGYRVDGDVKDSEFVRVQVDLKSGGGSGIVFAQRDYDTFQRNFDVIKSDELRGKSVVAIYRYAYNNQVLEELVRLESSSEK